MVWVERVMWFFALGAVVTAIAGDGPVLAAVLLVAVAAGLGMWRGYSA